MAVDLHVAEAGSGRPVVLLHAFPLSGAMWDAQLDALAPVCRLLVPDQRGFGASPLGADPPSLDAVADDVAALLDARGVDRAVLGGVSMGGYVAMAFARRHPQRLAGLVLVDTRASADAPAAGANRERIAAAVTADPDSRVLLDDVLPGLLGATTKRERPAVRARVEELVRAAPPAAVAWAQRAMAARPGSFDTLAGLAVPALVVVGEEDELTPPAEAAAMVAALPDARLVVVPAAGHLTPMEAPEAVTAAVREFLSR